ncbi:hypothetical protein NDU88_005415 [Pleurodeles waltl]|uniref:Uncharacterized protein n=1 Tax=Pleurodeles waltl TaxID=8319 RepID=A0AAV7PJI5_PLEWA|nr:hypothetical protein NDU88_005415 [Pleurodeles waltl]
MSVGRRLHTGDESGAASWGRAAMEIQISCRAAARVSLRVIGGRGSTSCPAIPREPPLLKCAKHLDSDRHSKTNQAEIRLACESLEKKIDLLALRTQALEDSVESMREDLRKNKEEIQQLKETELTREVGIFREQFKKEQP